MKALEGAAARAGAGEIVRLDDAAGVPPLSMVPFDKKCQTPLQPRLGPPRRAVRVLIMVRRRLGAGAVDVAHIPLSVLRGFIAGGVGHVRGDGVEFCRLLFVDMLDRALAMARGKHAEGGEQNGDGAGLHRVLPNECGQSLNARAEKCGSAAHAFAASRAV